jgi:hypothetical protein
MYVALALQYAKENMNGWTWKMCCEKAIEMLKICGMRATSCALTVIECYRKFRLKRGFQVYIARKDLPPFLQMNPEICTTIKQYAREHLAEVSIEILFEYVHSNILPQLVVDVCEDILHILPNKGEMQQTDNAQRTANAPPYATTRLPIPLTPYVAASM